MHKYSDAWARSISFGGGTAGHRTLSGPARHIKSEGRWASAWWKVPSRGAVSLTKPNLAYKIARKKHARSTQDIKIISELLSLCHVIPCVKNSARFFRISSDAISSGAISSDAIDE